MPFAARSFARPRGRRRMSSGENETRVRTSQRQAERPRYGPSIYRSICHRRNDIVLVYSITCFSLPPSHGIPRCFRRVGRCVTTSDDNFLGRTSPPRGSSALLRMPSDRARARGEGCGRQRERQQSHFPSGELSSPRNIVADIVFDATRSEARRAFRVAWRGDNGENAVACD